MSRTLARLRDATGDELLVRAGRGLVFTPHADALRTRVASLVQEARAMLQPASDTVDVATLERLFTIRANEGFVDAFAGRIVTEMMAIAPGLRLRFAPKPGKDVRALREGMIDLEIGVLGATGPEVRIQTLFKDRFVGVVHEGHALSTGRVTPQRYAACRHVVVSRRGRIHGPVDDALSALGLTRQVVAVVSGFPAALAMTCGTDLVALVTHSFISAEQERVSGTHYFELPVATDTITISQMWHPRLDADPAHRWLRGFILSACRARHQTLLER